MQARKKLTMAEAVEKGLVSQDVAEKKREQLKQLLPEVFADGRIDLDQLQRVLGDWVAPDKERYGLTWPGKADCMRLIQAPSTATLKPNYEESVAFDDTQNVFIEGDNLEVLKLLQKAYFGKVKMIYIDPPYNTGGDFIYPDNYREPLETYLAYSGQVDDEGRQFSTSADQEGRLHSRWLSLIYPRLYLARNLLRDDGLIFISIDNKEVQNLRHICDEIFGGENFVEQIAWKNKYGAGARTKGFIEVHEHILCYSKNPIDNLETSLSEEQKEECSGQDEKFEQRGGFVTQPLITKSLGDRRNLQYSITFKGDVISPRKQWVWERERLERAIENNEVVIKKQSNGDYSVRAKVYLYDETGNIRKGNPLSLLNGPFNQQGTKETAELIGSQVFDFPKPVALLKGLFSFSVNEKEDNSGLYLDFFAGSAVSAQAVVELNKEGGGSRRYIMVQLPEPCEDTSAAYKQGFRNIADIGRQRIRKVHERIETQGEGGLALESGDDLDLGFRSFHLARSNFNIWGLEAECAGALVAQLELHADHVDQASAAEDILYELILKAGFELTTKVEKIILAGRDVFAVAGGALLICLDKEITLELIDALADAGPRQVICLDDGFRGNDQLKANAVQTFKSRAREGEEAIVFRTV